MCIRDRWYKAMVDFDCVSPRILMVKLKFEKVKVCVVVTYGPSKGNVEESTIFWDNLNDVLDGVSRSFRLIVLGDLNGWIGDKKRDGITGGFGVFEENENGRKAVSYTHLRAHETPEHLVCRLLLEKKKTYIFFS